MRILALESSCDESAAAFLDVRGFRVVRLEHVVASQAIHEKYGGVVPEVAAREHSATLPRVVAALAEKVTGTINGRALGKRVDVVAVTRGPGLVTSLRVGVDMARTLALAWGKKIVGVNHIEGHIYSNWLGENNALLAKKKDIFPALALVVSGGHTELLRLSGHGKYKLLGATRDDAAGEAFDKSAKLLGLGYPGGPAISRLAQTGNAGAYDFPRPMVHDSGHEFSFSGLKTAVRIFTERNAEKLGDEAFLADAAASIEYAIVDVLVEKTVRAARQTKAKTVLLAGGVAANGFLRERLRRRLAEEVSSAAFVEPSVAFCTDNAAMIAMAAFVRASDGKFDRPENTDVDGHWELGRQRGATS